MSVERGPSKWLDAISDPVRVRILCALGESIEATAAELRAHSHASDPTLRRHLNALIVLGVVREQPGESDGITPGRPPTRFSLEPAALTALRQHSFHISF
jgi:DNA-binding transcriptional ArsR family regulator